MKSLIRILFWVVICLYTETFAQEIDISSALKQIETGNAASAEQFLKSIKAKYPNAPEVIYLDACLTNDGEEAQKKYSLIVEKFSDFKYVDASLYKLFTYYFSLGYYKKAQTYLDKLQKLYPQSGYIVLANRTIPDIEENQPQQSLPEKIEQQKQVLQPINTKASNPQYTIQVGAFLSLENAKKLQDQLKREGFDSEVAQKEIGGSTFNIVVTGKYESENDADETIKQLDLKLKIKGRLVKMVQ